MRNSEVRVLAVGLPDGNGGPGTALSDPQLTVTAVETLRDAAVHLGRHDVCVVVQALDVPDEPGLRGVCRTVTEYPDVPLVVAARSTAERIAREAIREGAHDYWLHDAEPVTQLKERLMKAIDRHAFQRPLLQLYKRGQAAVVGEDELVLRRVSELSTLQEMFPDTFARLVAQYRLMLDAAARDRLWAAGPASSDAVAAVAQELRQLVARPRDVVDVHTAALRSSIREGSRQDARGVLEEGRVLVLRVMGHLLDRYRRDLLARAVRGDAGHKELG
ncbi:MAG: response regulator transcription factor [Deltaproteobacteria bacterium]|nr:response regulator transcription factor [Deltaproteobacteria bacterium]